MLPVDPPLPLNPTWTAPATWLRPATAPAPTATAATPEPATATRPPKLAIRVCMGYGAASVLAGGDCDIGAGYCDSGGCAVVLVLLVVVVLPAEVLA